MGVRNGVKAFQNQCHYFDLRGGNECERDSYIEEWFSEFHCKWSEQDKTKITNILKMREAARQQQLGMDTYDECLKKFVDEQMSKDQQEKEEPSPETEAEKKERLLKKFNAGGMLSGPVL